MKSVVIIPARYGSTRLPGKPLKKIAGQTMLSRVVALARKGIEAINGTSIVVATDDERIGKHCDELNVNWVITPIECRTGTDRANAAVKKLDGDYDFILNLQGDTPLTPYWFVTKLLNAYMQSADSIEVVTPVTRLSWNQLDSLRESKQKTPFTGTTTIVNSENKALWFSKNIIPGIRKEEQLRSANQVTEDSPSPVLRHIGIYGYRRETLERYVKLSEGYYEKLEGLEQLRILENGISITAVEVEYKGRPSSSGVDSPEDIIRAEEYIAKYGDPLSEIAL